VLLVLVVLRAQTLGKRKERERAWRGGGTYGRFPGEGRLAEPTDEAEAEM
jgi:hypothetical protein